jgi:2-oxoglutarate dehydrogenase E1 component
MLSRRCAGRLSTALRCNPTTALRSRVRFLATAATTFENGTNNYYAQEMYRSWKEDPKSVHASWNAYFSGLDKGLDSDQAFQPPPNLLNMPVPVGGAPTLHVQGGQDLTDHLKVQLLVRAYQVRGHHIANLDPLGILDPDLSPDRPVELELSHYGFTENDLTKEFSLGPGILPHFAKNGVSSMTLADIIKTCKRIYCKFFTGPHKLSLLTKTNRPRYRLSIRSYSR